MNVIHSVSNGSTMVPGPAWTGHSSSFITWNPKYLHHPLGTAFDGSNFEWVEKPKSTEALCLSEPRHVVQSHLDDDCLIEVANNALKFGERLAGEWVNLLFSLRREHPDLWKIVGCLPDEEIHHRFEICQCDEWWMHIGMKAKRLCVDCWPIGDEGYVLKRGGAGLN